MPLHHAPDNSDPSDALMRLVHEDWDTSDDESSSVDAEISADEEAPTDVAVEARCKYPSKFCGRARARKSNGTFHRFCQYHRNKANTNQKRWTSVRRQQAAVEAKQQQLQEMLALGLQSTSMPAMYPDSYGMPALLPDPVRLGHCPHPVELPLEDVHILHALLAGDVTPKQTMCDASQHQSMPLGWHTLSSLVEPVPQRHHI